MKALALADLVFVVSLNYLVVKQRAKTIPILFNPQ